MSSIAQSSPPLLSTSKKTELNINTYHKQQQALLEQFFTSILGQRSDHLPHTLRRCTLKYGLDVLRQRIEALVDPNLELYHKYACLLSDREVVEGAYLYTG